MNARQKRTVRRFIKVTLAALVAQASVWVSQGMPAVEWQFFAVPVAAAVLAAAEKALQPDKTPQPQQ